MGAALIVPTRWALLPARHQRQQHKPMFSIGSACGSVAAAGGPVLGGLLSEYNWRWIVVINVPIAVFALLVSLSMTKEPRQDAKIPDLLGVALLAVGMPVVVTALLYVSDWGLGSAWLWGMVGAGFAAMMLGGSLFLTTGWAWSPMVAGIGFAVGPGTAVATALVAGRTRRQPRWLAGLGGGFLVPGGALWFFFLDENADYFPVMLLGLMLTGAGAGIAQTGFLAGGVSALAAAAYAPGTGVLNTTRQIGSALGVAALIAITGAGTNAESYRLVWLVLAASGLMGIVSASLIRARPQKVGATAVQALVPAERA